jgi:tetratricopeptide (TPR) repeat protein
MTPERLRQIEELYHAALELAAPQRAELLERACAADESLRREVESLLAFEPLAEDFIETPAIEAVARSLAGQEATAGLEGRRLGHYEIGPMLGEGGVGRVYLARDLQLGRQVALKFLDERLPRDGGWLRRFEREARAASALSHPNILTVYEAGSEAGMPFLATELVEGQTLRQRLASGPMPPAEALGVAIQTAEALAAAHAAGIVHRDIKPENVMLRPDGYVKVLDFGLAKLTEAFSRGLISESASGSEFSGLTAPGAVLGTARYMSPEQARGASIDPRTDIFSLGVVLYEMLAGASPFDGDTTTDVIAAILYREPPPLASASAEVPAELERLVLRALSKDPRSRYGSAAELLEHLKACARQVDPAHDSSPSDLTRVPPAAAGPGRLRARLGRLTARQRTAGVLTGLLLAGLASLAVLSAGDPPLAVGGATHRGASGVSEARRLVLMGREAWNRRTALDLRQALEYFEQAAVLAPAHAPAHAGMADCWSLLPGHGGAPPVEAAPRARRAAQRALELDGDLAEAHAALGLYLKEHEWDFAGAERELRRALELDRGHAPAHQWLAELLVTLGRPDEALASAIRAQELDPVSAIGSVQAAWVLHQAGRHDEAAERLAAALRLDPAFPGAHFLLGRVQAQRRRFAEAIAASSKALHLAGDEALLVASLGHIRAAAGDGAEARRLVGELLERARHRYVPPVAIALLHSALDEPDAAFEWLGRAYDRRDPLLPRHLHDPQLGALRADPRYAELLRRFGLAPARD